MAATVLLVYAKAYFVDAFKMLKCEVLAIKNHFPCVSRAVFAALLTSYLRRACVALAPVLSSAYCAKTTSEREKGAQRRKSGTRPEEKRVRQKGEQHTFSPCIAREMQELFSSTNIETNKNYWKILLVPESMDNREFPLTRLENMNPKLYEAAMKGDMKLLISIMEVDCPPNLIICLTPQKNTALHIAVKFEQQEIVKRLIQLCTSLISQPNSKGDTPLHVAARTGRTDLTKLLTPTLNLNLTEGNLALEDGNPVRQAGSVALRMRNLEGNNPIDEALKKSFGAVALHLLAFEERHKLAREVNVAGESLLYLAADAGLDKVVQKIIDSGDYSTQGPDGQNPLHIAVIKGVVQILLDKERNFIPQADCFGNTVLHYASAKSYYRELKDKDKGSRSSPAVFQKQILGLLLQANPSLAYVPDRNGDYPLFIAARKDFYCAAAVILDYCPDSIELVNQKGQNALHLAVIKKNWFIIGKLLERLEFKKLINEPDNDGNTPMHLATQTDRLDIVRLLICKGSPDLTMSNKQGRTAIDICDNTKKEHPIFDKLTECGAVPDRHRWQDWFPSRRKKVKIRPEFKTLGLQTLPIVTSLVATVTFAAALTVPGGYKNDGPREGLPVFMRNAALQAFVLSDILAFCSSMAATVLLVYANAHSEDAFMIDYALKTCYYISGVAILATITAFVTALYVLTSKESLWLAVTSLLLGFAVPLFLFCYRWFLKKRKWNLFRKDKVDYSFKS
ncbi:protein ACCELERATED CELL DEATH 6-like protein [Cinnamomum micranthum f. kanehirae]|uniref:Protein ACCELERATED CELL DEATH 6-like protein n=1 Tax=Cinnamomum micranthum f. kanehirae TaxID=337451 RepID=A0A3S3QQW1_9MAGN|nr:protein ACCELERATED CELL DEATH 6-like protein [Cinnamomum micranthum f. kanehirae]